MGISRGERSEEIIICLWASYRVLNVWKNGTSGTLLATLTLATTAAGKFAYEQAASAVTLTPGDRIDVELDVIAEGTGAAGQGWLGVVVDYIPVCAVVV